MRFKIHLPVVMLYSFAVCLLVLCAPVLSVAGSGEELKDFTTFSFIDNKQINTAEMRGSILVMVFGSIYCKPCVELLPVMDILNQRYEHGDVKILLLDIDMAVDPELQREFVKRHAIKAPYIVNALEIARNNKVYMLPTTLIVDRKGEIVKRIYGFKKIKKFEKVIKKLRPVIAVPEINPQPADPEDNQTDRQIGLPGVDVSKGHNQVHSTSHSAGDGLEHSSPPDTFGE